MLNKYKHGIILSHMWCYLFQNVTTVDENGKCMNLVKYIILVLQWYYMNNFCVQMRFEQAHQCDLAALFKHPLINIWINVIMTDSHSYWFSM